MKKRIATYCLLLAISCVFSGCIAGVIYDSFDKVIPAEFDIEDRPTLVFIEDETGNVKRPIVLHRIRSLTGNYIVLNEGLSEQNLIDPGKVDLAAKHEKDFHKWSITKIGRYFKAEQVIRIRVVNYSTRESQLMIKPEIGLRVKLIDVTNNTVIYPRNPEGRFVETKGIYEFEDHGNQGSETLLLDIATDRVAKKAAKLFYEHVKPRGNDKDL